MEYFMGYHLVNFLAFGFLERNITLYGLDSFNKFAIEWNCLEIQLTGVFVDHGKQAAIEVHISHVQSHLA